ncbi:uncharacterized protein LOC120704312 [Panicum virgatum]|uniref:Ternary complex factor MIP1-like n=1 Tax=Panicum virgatum TaxID=38727 RepID=A0A8T0U100_PANVG|nr:uncharacterized protein LOC120704312 [Panicum virgatum]KAG2613889.1 hypothetical protein PVAP13_4KG387700 [Panicum virgatum]
MLCVRAEDALAAAAASDKMRSVTLGGSIQRAVRRMAGGGGRRSGGSARAGSGGGGAPASCSGDDTSIGSGKREGGRRCSIRQYRSQLEQEVKKLQRQLQEEIDLHLALADAITYNAALILKSSIKLPDKAHELLISVASLEIAITKLEEDLNHLHYQLCHARNERLLAENNPGCLLPSSDCQPSTACDSTGEEHASMLRDLEFRDYHSMEEDFSTEPEDLQDDEKETEGRERVSLNRLLEKHRDVSLTGLLDHRKEEMQEPCSMEKESKEDQKIDALPFSRSNLTKSSMGGNVWNNPNQLSEEMVRSMKDIFLHLSASSKISPKATFANSSSSAERLSGSTLTSLSDSSVIASVLRSPSIDLHHEDIDEVKNFDPYNVNGKEACRDIGSYCSVVEVSWMYIGNDQLEYASGALKKFRFLVEQLSKIDPSSMNCDERLAFWINLYNALIMHAYLAYGVPENDFKLFSLMQKACYTVCGQPVSAAEIEFVILKMKTPVHRPQLSLMLALHKFKTSEKLKKYSIDNTEPLMLFALCCGMFSSPAVRIFSAGNVRQELQESMRDYIRASVGINDKGELIVPKLLQSYAKGIVEDSLLADWICRHLTLDQVAAIQESSSSHKQRLLGVRSFSVIPFDSRFRYLFLSDNSRCQS